VASPALDPDVQAFRMPAEWEPHEATWLGWPHNLSDWPGRFAPIPWVYGEIVRKLAEGELVRILVPSKAHEAKARRILERVGASTERVEFFRFPSDRGWTRDFGPVCVRREHPKPEVAVARFRFNGWAKYEDHKKDDQIAERAAKALGLRLRRAVYKGRPVVLEGGAIDVCGRGTILTTEECLLDPFVQVRNPGFKRGDYEQVFLQNLGATHAIWLGKGIAGDDTHGHVDDLCRFVNAKTIVLCRERGWADVNYRTLEENRERLQGARSPRWWSCRCRPRSSSTAAGYPRATPTSTSRTPPCWCPPSTTRTTAWRSGSWPSSSRTVRSWASTPSSWSGASARSTA